MEERERRRLEMLATVELSEASLARGEGRYNARGIGPTCKRHHPARLSAACRRPTSTRMNYRLSSQAEAQLDDIWLYVARESGSVDTAIRIVQNISDRFWLLAKQPRMGRRRPDLSPKLRSFAAGDYVILYSIEDDDLVLIHYVCHGSQDIESLFHY